MLHLNVSTHTQSKKSHAYTNLPKGDHTHLNTSTIIRKSQILLHPAVLAKERATISSISFKFFADGFSDAKHCKKTGKPNQKNEKQ